MHTRTTVFQGFKRADGLWGIDGELLDTKAKPLPIPGEPTLAPREPLHGMAIRVTINDQFVIQAIERNLGGICGCTHLRELLFDMATAAFQTLAHELAEDSPKHAPPYFGKCTTWDFNGPVVARLFPQFAGGSGKGNGDGNGQETVIS